jgi:hypothetical protein
MSRPRDELIHDLVEDLRPVRRPGRIAHWLFTWLPLAILVTVVALVATGPFRDGSFRSLLSWPGFAAETIVAGLAVALLARATLVSSLPGTGRPPGPVLWPAVVLVAWVGFYVAGFWFPAHPVSSLGHREHCFLQTQLIALVNLGLLLWIARRLAPLWPRTTGALAGAAAAAVPAALMQFACMYDPAHILATHLVPIAITAAIGAVLGPWVLVRRARASIAVR